MERDARPMAAAALFGASGVALGAFGAHGLRATLSAGALGWWQTGVQYQMWHALALLGLAAAPVAQARLAATLFALGILIFSGSLYAMALTGVRALGMVTPLGGALLIAGWLALAWRALRGRR